MSVRVWDPIGRRSWVGRESCMNSWWDAVQIAAELLGIAADDRPAMDALRRAHVDMVDVARRSDLHVQG